MTRWVAACLVVVAGAWALPARADEGVVEITATGEGITPGEARKAALRKALEQGGRSEIFSHSEVQDFQLIKDTIIARAQGIVTEYRIVEERPAVGGSFLCTIRAKVSHSAVASAWGAVQNVLQQIGRPGVMVMITERIDGTVDNSSILESKIEERLIKAGFDVYAGEQVRAIAHREADDASAGNNVAKLQAIAKSFGTQIFITGAANANAAGVRNVHGELAAMYNGDCAIKMYYTDTGRLLASESIPNWRGGARGVNEQSLQAGKKALANAGEVVVEKVYATVMEQWSTAISAGRETRVEVEGLQFADALKIKRMLESTEGIDEVHYEFTKGIATYRLLGQLSTEELAERLVGAEWRPLVEIVDVKMNRIQAKKPVT